MLSRLLGVLSADMAIDLGTANTLIYVKGGRWMFVGPLMVIVLIAAVMAVVVLMIRWLGGSGPGTAPHPPPQSGARSCRRSA